jgi:prephenate dehydrogenase
MRIAILGVGLIGGSIGLAARKRLGAEVAGFDADPATALKAVESGAIDEIAVDVAAACADAEIVFCAAPVGVLGALVGEALARSPEDCVITDVGSTKRELAAAHSQSGRFIGGHPLAGAETAGVEHARENLFEGARWYLTPNEASHGVLYDRLQRFVTELGARPQAIDAETHDRVMATVSHLPHVLANVLVTQAAEALSEEAERIPEVGPSFRDATRVAGANPAIWEDIFVHNSEAVTAEIDAVVERLSEAAALMRAGERSPIATWHGRARQDRRTLLESDLAGGPVTELRVLIPNRPGTVAELALALGRAQVNIEDMALYPSADNASGAVSLWIAGAEEAERAAEIVRGLGHDVAPAGGES